MKADAETVLRELVESIDAFLEGENKTDRVMPQRMRTAYLAAHGLLDVPATGTASEPEYPSDEWWATHDNDERPAADTASEHCPKREWEVHCPCWTKGKGPCCACGENPATDTASEDAT